jgi:hypothetical protein
MRLCKEKGYISENHSFIGAEFSTASFDTEHFTRKELEELYFKEALKLNMSLVTRNFYGFFMRWGSLILRHPWFAANTIANYFFRTRKKGAYGDPQDAAC